MSWWWLGSRSSWSSQILDIFKVKAAGFSNGIAVRWKRKVKDNSKVFSLSKGVANNWDEEGMTGKKDQESGFGYAEFEMSNRFQDNI